MLHEIDIVDLLQVRNAEAIPIIPVRMSEAWLLIDIDAIRKAARNPNGKATVELPDASVLENLPDPKRTLIQLLEKATNNNKRRRKSFKVRRAIHDVAELIDDYSPLLRLSAFRSFYQYIQEVEPTITEKFNSRT